MAVHHLSHSGCLNRVQVRQARRSSAVPGAQRLFRHVVRSPCRSMPTALDAVATEVEVFTHTQHGSHTQDPVLLQAFGWESCRKGNWYGVVQSKIPDMKALGVTHVWLPPPSQSVAEQGYLPGQLYNLNSKYGNKEQLKELVSELKSAGMCPMADIVINHRCADEMVNGIWNRFRDDVDHEGRKIDWGKWAITGNDPVFGGTGNPDTGDDYGPAPDLDHLNVELRSALKDWMNWLIDDIGFAAWRFDFVKGYGAQFINEYVTETVGTDSFNVGEFWVDLRWNGSDLDYNQDAARQRLCDWIDQNGKTACAFDFPTKGILQEACKHTQYNRLRGADGKPPGLVGWWPNRAVTFIDNHDTGSSQMHWPFPGQHVPAGYAYILTHPGIPTLFWEHYFDWGHDVQKQIKQLVHIRQRNNIHPKSKLEILAADHDMYFARIDDRLCLKLGPRYDMGCHLPKKEAGWKLAASGHDYAVWEKHPGGNGE